MNCQIDIEFMRYIVEMSVKLNPSKNTDEVQDFLNLYNRTTTNDKYDILITNNSSAYVDVLSSSLDTKNAKRNVLMNKIIYNKSTKKCNILGGRVKCWFCSSYIREDDKRWILPSSKVHENEEEIMFTGEGAFCTWNCTFNYFKKLTTKDENIKITLEELGRNLKLLYKYYAELPYQPYPLDSVNKYERTDFEEYGGRVKVLNYLAKSRDLEE